MGVIIAVAAVWLLQKNVPTPYSYPANGSPTPSSVLKAGSKSSTKLGQPAANVTYTELINQYAGKLVQFDDLCHGTPGQLVVKKGTKIMLDNRSKNALIVMLDSQTVNLPAYHYQIVAITTSKPLPYDLGIDCKSPTGSGTNSATVQIQAAILQLLK